MAVTVESCTNMHTVICIGVVPQSEWYQEKDSRIQQCIYHQTSPYTVLTEMERGTQNFRFG